VITLENWGSAGASGKRARTSNSLSTAMYNRFKRMWRDAIKAFIVTAVDTMAENIDTGMSVASFRPLAAEVRLRKWIITFGGHGPKYNCYGPSKPYGIRSQAAGERLGQKAYEVTFGDESHWTMTLKFSIVVYQHYLHEASSNYSNSLDWHSLDKGLQACVAYIKDHFDDYNLGELIRKWWNVEALPNE